MTDQTADAKTNAAQTDAAKGTGGADRDLEAILNEATEGSTDTTKPATPDKKVELLWQDAENRARREAYADLDATVDAVSGDHPKVPRKFIRNEIEKRITSDRRAGTLFAERHNARDRFVEFAKAVAKEVADEVKATSEVDDQATANRGSFRESVRAAARSATPVAEHDERDFSRKYVTATPAERDKMRKEMFQRNEAARGR